MAGVTFKFDDVTGECRWLKQLYGKKNGFSITPFRGVIGMWEMNGEMGDGGGECDMAQFLEEASIKLSNFYYLAKDFGEEIAQFALLYAQELEEFGIHEAIERCISRQRREKFQKLILSAGLGYFVSHKHLHSEYDSARPYSRIVYNPIQQSLTHIRWREETDSSGWKDIEQQNLTDHLDEFVDLHWKNAVDAAVLAAEGRMRDEFIYGRLEKELGFVVREN